MYFDNTEDRKDGVFSFMLRPEILFKKRYFVNIIAQYINQNSSLSRYSIEKALFSLNVGFYY